MEKGFTETENVYVVLPSPRIRGLFGRENQRNLAGESFGLTFQEKRSSHSEKRPQMSHQNLVPESRPFSSNSSSRKGTLSLAA
jgi:hypothetical protein